MDENHFQAAPVALCGFVLLKAAAPYNILARILIAPLPAAAIAAGDALTTYPDA
jgi:hypothetical protein